MKLIMGNKKFEEEINNNSVYKQIKEKEALSDFYAKAFYNLRRLGVSETILK